MQGLAVLPGRPCMPGRYVRCNLAAMSLHMAARQTHPVFLLHLLLLHRGSSKKNVTARVTICHSATQQLTVQHRRCLI
jgi:hypothetical protein